MHASVGARALTQPGALLDAGPRLPPPVTGVVRDPEGGALRHVHVLLVELRREVLTDSLGRFAFGPLPAGSYALSFQRVGVVPAMQRVVVSAEAPAAPLEVTLRLTRTELASVTVSASAVATTAQRATQPTAVLSGRALRTSQAASVGETLASLAGVRSLSLSTGIGKPVIRGLHSQRVVTMADGNRIDSQQWGVDHAPNLETATAERIEVIKGPASVLHGAEAIGGVVHVIPRALPWGRAGTDAAVARELIASYNSNLRAPDVTATAEATHGRIGWRAVGTGRIADDMRAASGPLRNTGNRTGHGELTLAARPSWGEVRLVGSSREERIEIFEDPAEEPDFDGFQRLSTQRLAMHVDRAGATGRWELRLSGERNDRREFEGTEEPLPALGLRSTIGAGRLTFTHRPLLGGWQGTIGVSGTAGMFTKHGRETLIPSNDTRGLGAFAFEQRSFGRLELMLGARSDWQTLAAREDAELALLPERRRFSAFTGTLGAAWQVAEPLVLAANVGRGFRAPTAQELYANGFHEGSRAFERGDRTLRTETALNADVALRLVTEAIRGEVSVFRNAVRDFIYLRPFGTGGQLFDSLQVVQGDALLRGAEVSVEWRPLVSLALTASGDLVRGTNTTIDQPLLFMPPARVFVGVRRDASRWWRLLAPYADLSVEAIDRQRRIEPRDVAPPGTTLLHAGVGATLPAGGRLLVVDVTARNLANARWRDHMSRYKEFADALGRAVVVRVRTSW
jgi:iron complex outermembrane receptor protein